MRILKTIGIVLVSLIALLLIVAALSPKGFDVEKSTVIDASAEAVFPHVQYFEKRDAWYPWGKDDPTNVTSIEGTDGTVGAISNWEGETTGKGSQTITAIEANKHIETELAFVEPYESVAETYMNVEAVDGGTKVSWGLSSAMSFPFNAMLLFMDPEAAVGADYEKGLAALKRIVEEEAQHASSYEVKEVDLPVRYFLAIQEDVGMYEIEAHYTENLPKVAQACQKNKIEMAGMPCGIYYSQDMYGNTFDLAQAIPVSSKTNLKGFTNIEIPAGKALQVDYYGGYYGMADAHKAIDNYCKSKGITSKRPVIEQYITDPETEPDSSKWLTTIYYPIED